MNTPYIKLHNRIETIFESQFKYIKKTLKKYHVDQLNFDDDDNIFAPESNELIRHLIIVEKEIKLVTNIRSYYLSEFEQPELLKILYVLLDKIERYDLHSK